MGMEVDPSETLFAISDITPIRKPPWIPVARSADHEPEYAMNIKSMNDRLSVLFIVPSLRRAGAETQVVNLVNGLDPYEFQKHLLIFEDDASQLGRIDTQQVHFHHASRTRRWFDYKLLAQVVHVIDEHKIDVVHCSLQFALFWGWLASKRSNKRPKVIAALHTTINVDLKTELQDRIIYQWILRDCDGIFFVCERQREYWERRYPFLIGRSTVVHNGVDTGKFDPLAFTDLGAGFRQNHGIPRDVVVLSSVARFSPEKGQHLLVSACSEIKDFDAYVVFAGAGPLRKEIEEQVRVAGLAKQVRFVGDLEDVRPLLAASDLLVLPSTAVETFSMAMLEALAMRTPVLGSDIGGMREAVIENETGVLVEPGDISGLAMKIRSLVSDKAHLKEMGLKGRQLVMDKFSESHMINRTGNAIRDSLRLDKTAEH